MYELLIEASFRARHALCLRGEWEEPHWHDWHIVARYAGAQLDEDGLLADFHALEADLAAVIDPIRGRDLNDCPEFRAMNPSAEHVARHIAQALAARRPGGNCLLADVTVSEAPACRARYLMPTK